MLILLWWFRFLEALAFTGAVVDGGCSVLNEEGERAWYSGDYVLLGEKVTWTTYRTIYRTRLTVCCVVGSCRGFISVALDAHLPGVSIGVASFRP